jgi:hypothetical protein
MHDGPWDDLRNAWAGGNFSLEMAVRKPTRIRTGTILSNTNNILILILITIVILMASSLGQHQHLDWMVAVTSMQSKSTR